MRPEPAELFAGEAADPRESHLVLCAGPGGYRLLERAGGSPAPGERVTLDGETFDALRVGRSPLPGDGRLCAFLHAVS